MSKTHQIHDLHFKDLLSNDVVLKDFLSCFIPKEVLSKVDMETLTPVPTSFISKNVLEQKKEEKRVDILYSMNINNEIGYCYVLLEHQSSEDDSMPLRLHRYILEIIEYHKNTKKTNKLPVVFPILYYNGKYTYKKSRTILDMYETKEEKELMENVFTKGFHLVDLNLVEDDEKLRNHEWARMITIAMQSNTSRYRKDVYRFARKMKEILLSYGISLEREVYELIESIICYNMDIVDIDDEQEYLNIVKEGVKSREIRGDIMSLAERIEQRGIQKGRQEGIDLGVQKGIDQGMKYASERTALAMLADNLDIKEIARLTKLSIEDVKRLKSEI